ncbi:MAG TPA: NHLP leader peptide family RiPP precursor [Elusimicrobiota bacterium]|nr:NHLP leader peptide family RiPP precursor [Elusimicrobiota bacterium]
MSESKDAKTAKDKIIKKALMDPAFKKALIADPNAAIAKELKLAPSVQIKVVEDTANVVHLVLPVMAGSKGELSEDDLGKVSGGRDGCGLSGNIGGDVTKPPMIQCSNCTGDPKIPCR